MTARRKTGSALPAPRPLVHELDCDGLRACRAASAFGPPRHVGGRGPAGGSRAMGEVAWKALWRQGRRPSLCLQGARPVPEDRTGAKAWEAPQIGLGLNVRKRSVL